MNSSVLWKERFGIFVQELQKYLRYIFNGHLLFVLIIGLGGLAYYYSEWVKSLDEGFPAALLLSIIIAFPLTNSPVHTLLKEPDMFFLLPVETRLQPYFKKSINFSLVLQSYILLLFLAAGMPMYAAVEKGSFSDFFWILILLIVVKYVNLRIKWSVLKFEERSTHLMDSLIRYCINGALLYVTFSKGSLLFMAIVLMILTAIWLYYENAVKSKRLRWEHLISLESKRMMAFYRFANLFTDVPKLKQKPARRKWMDPILKMVSYKQKNAYMYLYVRTFARSSDFLGLVARLTVIGLLIELSLDTLLPQMITAGLIVYLTGIQLMAIRKQHENLIWHDLYPVAETVKDASILKLLNAVMAVQIVIFAAIGLITNSAIAAIAIVAVSLAVVLLLQGTYRKLVKVSKAKWD
ncbi:ABC transporter permease [Bacillus testis]|uniref:ABC transporter permease n=1 Tax=Bacillus testis TaxID=1622072 RepID=UPI00067EF71C|nr:ABC transporter permease [Bacillus testis]